MQEIATNKKKAELRSGITAPFNKGLNEALQFTIQMPWYIENSVQPSQLIGILKGEQGTPGLPAAISVLKDQNNYVALLTAATEVGNLRIRRIDTTLSNPAGETMIVDTIVPAGKKWILKKAETANSTFVGTQSSISLQFRDKINTISVNFFTSATNFDSYFVQPITLNAGDTLRVRMVTTAWTSGQKIVYLIYQEVDI